MCDRGERVGVIPVESPTVAIADTASKREFRKSAFSTLDIIAPTTQEKERYSVNTHNTFRDT